MAPSAFILALFLLTGCGDDFAATQAAGTIEAYEAFLKDNPNSRHTLAATAVLETLFLEQAREEARLEAYDQYLERFPEGNLHERALEERETFLFDWAKERGTAPAWERFLKEYPHAQKKRKATAHRLLKVGKYLDKLTWTPLKIEPVNMAEDPEGPKDGWGFTSSVTNNGTRTLTDLRFTIALKSPTGGTIVSEEWPVVAKVWPLPIEEEHKVPMRPGETRIWKWSTTAPASGKWKQEATLTPTRIAFVK